MCQVFFIYFHICFIKNRKRESGDNGKKTDQRGKEMRESFAITEDSRHQEYVKRKLSDILVIVMCEINNL